MQYSVRAILKKDKVNAAGQMPVVICVTVKRKRIFRFTGHKATPSQFVDGKMKASVKNYALINASITKQIAEIEQELITTTLRDVDITINTAKTILTGGKINSDYHAHASSMLDELKKHKTLGTWRKNKVDADKLKAYAPTLSFADVTPVFLTKYHKHLQNEGLSNNTIWAAFKHIRQVLNHAKSLGVTSYYPFKEWKVPKYKEQPRNYLVKEDLDRLRDLLDKPLNDTFKLVTAFFLLECYSGIRHSDWAKFNIEKLLDGENMILRATKTGVRVTIPLDVYPSLNWVVSYIRDNGLVYDLSGQKTNIYLKSIAAMAGIDKTVTTHIGRHTFAVLMLEKGFTKELIAELMGVSMRVVNTYAKYTTNKARVEFERLGGL